MVSLETIVSINSSLILATVIGSIGLFLEARKRLGGSQDAQPKDSHLQLLYKSYLTLGLTMILSVASIIVSLFYMPLGIFITVFSLISFTVYFFSVISSLSIGYTGSTKIFFLPSIWKIYRKINVAENKKIEQNHKHHSSISCITIIIMLLLAGLFLYFYLNLNEITPNQDVQFRFRGFNHLNGLEGLKFNYNFDHGEGFFEFRIVIGNNTNPPISITIPRSIKLSNWTISNSQCKIEEIKNGWDEKEWNFTNCYFNVGDKKDVKIFFSGNITPSGSYRITFPSIKVGSQIYLSLGNRYRCLVSCISYNTNGLPIIKTENSNEIIEITNNEEESLIYFFLMTTDTEIKFWKDLFFALFATLLGGVLSLIGGIIVNKTNRS